VFRAAVPPAEAGCSGRTDSGIGQRRVCPSCILVALSLPRWNEERQNNGLGEIWQVDAAEINFVFPVRSARDIKSDAAIMRTA